jgi:hypothetical protein
MPLYIILCLLYACTPVGKKETDLYRVTVDRTYYGLFTVEGLETFDHRGLPKKDHYTVVKLSRHFLIPPSLYKWAREERHTKHLPKNMYLSGDKYILLLGCQPLSWMTEIDPHGGYYEQVEFTVLRKAHK